MQILLLGVFITLCTGCSLAVLNTSQSNGNYSDSKDKAAAVAGYNEHAQQYQPSLTQQQQQQQSSTALGYQYKAPAPQYPTTTTTQSLNTQTGYNYQALSSQQQPISIGSGYYQHSSIGPALALDVLNALPAKQPVQAGHYFVHNQQADLPTQTPGYNNFASRPNHFALTQQQPQRETVSGTAAASSILDNSNTALLNTNSNAASERQNFLLQKLAQLNLLGGTKDQVHTNNLINANQEPQSVSNAQFVQTNSEQVNTNAFRQPSQGYAYARPAPTVSNAYYTNNKQQAAHFGGAAAPTTLSNFEYSKQQAAFGELSKQPSLQTTHLDNNEKYTQSTNAGQHSFAQSDRYYSQQLQPSDGYNYAQAGNGLNVATQASFQPQDYPYPAGNKALPSFIAGSQNALLQNEAGHKTSSYYQGSPNSQQQVLLQTTSSGPLSSEQFPREQQQIQQQQQHQYQLQQLNSHNQQHSQLASTELPSLGLPSTAYVYQKMQSQSYELPTIVQQSQDQPQSYQMHQAVRRPHELYGIPVAEREVTPVSASASAYSPARGQYQAPYF